MSKKNKKSIKSKDVLDVLDIIQNQTLISFKSSAELLRDAATSLIKKIDAEGSKGFYSMNNDCMRYSEATWRHSLRLCELRLLKADIEDQIRKNASSDSNNETAKDK